MAKEEKVLEKVRNLGFIPEEDMTIIVKYRSDNLAGKIEDFFSGDFYILQICLKEIMLLKININKLTWIMNISEEDVLVINKEDIEYVEISDGEFNYSIDIKTKDSLIKLTSQVKALSGWRSSGGLTADNIFDSRKNWHSENIEATLEELSKIKK